MRLTQSQKNLVLEQIAIGTRPIAIVNKINDEFKPAKLLARNQVTYYLKIFRNLSPEEQLTYLPYTMQESFARQEVRINSDIRQLQRTEEKLNAPDVSNDDFVQLSRLSVSIKNRIAQELGQALAYSKAGVGNLTIMQNIFNQYRGFIKGAEDLPQEDVVDLLESFDKVKEEKLDEPKPRD